MFIATYDAGFGLQRSTPVLAVFEESGVGYVVVRRNDNIDPDEAFTVLEQTDCVVTSDDKRSRP